ncbi:MAG: hypothetical protein ACLVCH_04445 [Roseburia inulinivorans]
MQTGLILYVSLGIAGSLVHYRATVPLWYGRTSGGNGGGIVCNWTFYSFLKII